MVAAGGGGLKFWISKREGLHCGSFIHTRKVKIEFVICAVYVNCQGFAQNKSC